MTESAPDIAAVRQALAVSAAVTPDMPIHVRAFVAWAIGDVSSAAALMAEVADAEGAQRNPTHVASAGYAAAMSVGTAADAFLSDLDWLRQRTFFERKPYGHEIDGLVLLGLALGIRAIGAGDVRQLSMTWLSGLVTKAISAAPPGDWNAFLIRTAAVVLTPDAAAIDDVAPEMVATLAARGILPADAVPRDAAWHAATISYPVDDGPSRAAARLATYDLIWKTAATISLGTMSLDDVARVLERVPAAMSRWPWEDKQKTPKSAAAKWIIDNEYHVQSLLWAILAPLFPRLVPEEPTPSVGQKHPRADLAIPELEAVVEVKFVRASAKFADIVEEIAADASLYLQRESPYRHLVVFVWDDSGRSEEHDALRSGLLKIAGVRHAIVVSRPGRMARE